MFPKSQASMKLGFVLQPCKHSTRTMAPPLSKTPVETVPRRRQFLLLNRSIPKQTAAASTKEKISLQNSVKLAGMCNQKCGLTILCGEGKYSYVHFVSGTLSVHDLSAKKSSNKNNHMISVKSHFSHRIEVTNQITIPPGTFSWGHSHRHRTLVRVGQGQGSYPHSWNDLELRSILDYILSNLNSCINQFRSYNPIATNIIHIVVKIIQLKYRWISPDHGCPGTKTLKVRSKHGKPPDLHRDRGGWWKPPIPVINFHVSQVVRSFATGVDSLWPLRIRWFMSCNFSIYISQLLT